MISIIIPTYNNLELFKRAYHSVSSQTVKNVEVIVVDDSSSNDIEKYCLQIPVRYHHNRPALGAVKNWNSGLKMAKGDYIILMHHDEAMKENDYLSSLLNSFGKGYDIVISNIEIHKGDVTRIGLCPNRLKRIFISHSYLLLVRNLIGPCACVSFKRECLTFFDEHLKWSVDIEWYYRLLYKRKVAFNENNWISSIHGHKGQITKNLNVPIQARLDAKYLFSKYQGKILPTCCLITMRIVGFVIRIIRTIKAVL